MNIRMTTILCIPSANSLVIVIIISTSGGWAAINVVADDMPTNIMQSFLIKYRQCPRIYHILSGAIEQQ